MAAGFGPGHASAVTDRPAPRANLFQVQTWFRDASAPGATDGTVLDAGFLNFLVGNLIRLCQRGNVDPANDQAGDDYIADAVSGLIVAALDGISGLTYVNHDTTLDGDGTPGSPLGISATILAQLAQLAQLIEAIAAERSRAIGVEEALARRLQVLEEGKAPRATPSAYGFARLGSTDSGGGADPAIWTLI